jgi:hypothetical protein
VVQKSKKYFQLFRIEIQSKLSKIGILAENEPKKEEKSDFDQQKYDTLMLGCSKISKCIN